MIHIDFFGGSHGNFLDIIINIFIKQFPFPSDYNIFNDNGSSHNKKELLKIWAQSNKNFNDRAVSDHHSYFKKVNHIRNHFFG